VYLREWDAAERSPSRALVIDPHNLAAAAAQTNLRLNGHGDVEGARQAFDAVAPERVLALVSPVGIAGNVSGVIGGARVYLEVIARRFAHALTMGDTDPESKSPARAP